MASSSGFLDTRGSSAHVGETKRGGGAHQGPFLSFHLPVCGDGQTLGQTGGGTEGGPASRPLSSFQIPNPTEAAWLRN